MNSIHNMAFIWDGGLEYINGDKKKRIGSNL